jgi:uncharacterized membrane protein (DUF2068 family)
MPRAARSLGVRIITGYKLVKAPVTLILALWLTLAPRSALGLAAHAAEQISEGGATLNRLAHWMERHLTKKVAVDAALLAWFDGAATSVEGLLLLQGSAWAEWVVVFGLSALIPFEAVSLAHHPSTIRLVVLTFNGAIVAYLVVDRLRRRTKSA